MFKGNAVTLIPLEEKHIELIRKWRMQPEIYEYMFCAEPITDLAQKNWFLKVSTDKSAVYFIISQTNGTPIGLISLNDIDYKNGTVSWGYYIGELNYANMGYGAEAEYLILNYAFQYLRLNKVCCQMYTYNKDVISMHKRFGFKEEGLLRQQYFHRGDYQDIVLMGLLKQEYDEKKTHLDKLFVKRKKEKEQ